MRDAEDRVAHLRASVLGGPPLRSGQRQCALCGGVVASELVLLMHMAAHDPHHQAAVAGHQGGRKP